MVGLALAFFYYFFFVVITNIKSSKKNVLEKNEANVRGGACCLLINLKNSPRSY